MSIYTSYIKPILFRFDPEVIHDICIRVGSFLGRYVVTRYGLRMFFSPYESSVLEQDIQGIHFKNPIGLAAGFDKNAELTDVIPCVGFGHMEVGSITYEPCEGNPKPRLWRLKQSKGLVVYYGLKNNGAHDIHKRLAHKTYTTPVSVSIAMKNCVENLDIHTAIIDYARVFEVFLDTGDFLTVNISCPNTYGGQPFMEPDALEMLLAALDRIETNKPIFIKLSPDKQEVDIDSLLEVIDRHRVHGIICSNLTKNRVNKKIIDSVVPEKGGISGKPVQDLSDALLAHVYKKTQGKYVLVGCGGVFSAEDVYRKIRLGASLIHMITGMIYEGPHVISKICKDLDGLLKRDGFAHITHAIGVDVISTST